MDEISEKRERNMFSAPSERFMKQKIVKELKLVQRLVVGGGGGWWWLVVVVGGGGWCPGSIPER